MDGSRCLLMRCVWTLHVVVSGMITGSVLDEFIQRYLTAIRTYFTRWLIRTNSYDLTRTI